MDRILLLHSSADGHVGCFHSSCGFIDAWQESLHHMGSRRQDTSSSTRGCASPPSRASRRPYPKVTGVSGSLDSFLPARELSRPLARLRLQPGITCCLKFGIGFRRIQNLKRNVLSFDLKTRKTCWFAEKVVLQWAINDQTHQTEVSNGSRCGGGWVGGRNGSAPAQPRSSPRRVTHSGCSHHGLEPLLPTKTLLNVCFLLPLTARSSWM